MSPPYRCLLLAGSALVCATASAQQRGDFALSAGYLFVQTPDHGTQARTHLTSSVVAGALGVQQDFSSPGTSIRIDNASTIAFSGAYFVTDQLSINFNGGLPVRVDLRGQGTIAATGPTGAVVNVDAGDPDGNPIGSAKEWTPSVVLRYRFFDPAARLRPFLGVGYAYSWFTETRVNPNLAARIQLRAAAPLAAAAGKAGPTTIRTDASQSFDPVFDAGFNLALGGHWGISVSEAYVPISSTPSLDVFAADGTRLSHTTARLTVDALITSALLEFHF